MKKFFAIAFIATSLVACNNSAEKKDEVKDSTATVDTTKPAVVDTTKPAVVDTTKPAVVDTTKKAN
jgi:hypothetical protein